MNIFDQYGIKEVADVTLYAIELDKHDEEIYVPIMYFDTLKVSSIEQTASQTSAQGGLGNPELITWDFGKEITITLEDALYTPASQSLMWGGKFGINKTKIYGIWNPFVYPIDDRSGRQIYIKREPIELGAMISEQDKWVIRVLYSNQVYIMRTNLDSNDITLEPSDKEAQDITFEEGYDRYTILSQNYFYTYQDQSSTYYCVVVIDNNKPYFVNGTIDNTNEFSVIGEPLQASIDEYEHLIIINCPCDGTQKAFSLEEQKGHYKYYRNESYETTWDQDQMTLSYYTCPSGNTVVESVENPQPSGKYTIEGNKLADKTRWNEIPERALLTVDAFGQFQYHAYQFISIDDEDPNNDEYCFYKDIDFCDSDDIRCTTEHIDAYGYIWEDSDLKMTSLEGSQDLFYLTGVDLRYRIRVDNGQREIGLEYYPGKGDVTYQPKIDVFKKISYTTVNELGIEEKNTMEVLAGTYYIIDDWNLNGAPPQDFIYEINSGLNNVDYLERTEKCRAKQTFAIDADKNIRCNNYRYDHAYDTKELTVFIDPKTMKPYESNADYYQTRNGEAVEGNLTIIKQNQTYLKWTRRKAPDYTSLGYQIIVDAEHFPGTYKLVGETCSRAYSDGQDRRYQIEIPLCKMSAETGFTLEAAGDPTTFNMTFKVLRKDDGTMVKLTQYEVSENAAGSTDVVTTDMINDESVFDFAAAEPESSVVTRRTPSVASVTNRSYSIGNTRLTQDTSSVYVDQDTDAPNPVIPTFTQPSEEDLNKMVQDRGDVVETLYDENGQAHDVYNEQLSSSYDFNGDPYATPVLETTDYNISHEEYQARVDQYGNETRIPGTEVTIDEGTVTSNRFLSENEYTITDNNQITIEGGDNE